jgi:hypothetical protein
MVARGLAQRCDVLLMDEPDAHLDPRNQFRVLEVVSDLADEQGLSFVVVVARAQQRADVRRPRAAAAPRPHAGLGGVEETLTEPLLTRGVLDAHRGGVEGRERAPRGRAPSCRGASTGCPRASRRWRSSPTRSTGRTPCWRAWSREAPTRRSGVIVTGARGSGKSRWCAPGGELGAAARLARRRRARRRRASRGISRPASGSSTSRPVKRLAPLAARRRRRPGPTERWRFDDDVLALGERGAARAAEAHADLLVVDELGPLEFHRGIGFRRPRPRSTRPRYGCGLRGGAPVAARRGARALARRARRRRRGLNGVRRTNPSTRIRDRACCVASMDRIQNIDQDEYDVRPCKRARCRDTWHMLHPAGALP